MEMKKRTKKQARRHERDGPAVATTIVVSDNPACRIENLAKSVQLTQLTAQSTYDQRRRSTSTPPERDSSPTSSSFTSPAPTKRVSLKARTIAGRTTADPLPSPTEPLTVEEISAGTLTANILRIAAGTQQLQRVKTLQLVINSAATPSVEGVWAAVPSLQTLVLDGSRLTSFRDLGVDLRKLRKLSMEGSNVEDLDGIAVLSGLSDLRLGNNQISDVTALACHSNLQVLDLQRNRIGDMKALEILGTLPLLYSLNLAQNPLAVSLDDLPRSQGRTFVYSLIPQLRMLDESPLSTRDGPVLGDENLADANELVRRIASRTRAAWAEEDSSHWTDDGARVRGEREELDGSRLSPVSSRRWRQRDRAIESPLDRGIVHWDSDLTQGGREAFSGNPSSAIRRHKMGGDTSKRARENSPQRVLETLDLAKQMEMGLRERHNQLADRISEWGREVGSDSLSHEEIVPSPRTVHSRCTTSPRSDPGSSPPLGAAGSKCRDNNGVLMPPSPRNTYGAQAYRERRKARGVMHAPIHLNRTEARAEGPCSDRSDLILNEREKAYTTERWRSPERNRASTLENSIVAGNEQGEGKDDESIALRKCSAGESLDEASSRPWTTGHVVAGSRSNTVLPGSASSAPRKRASSAQKTAYVGCGDGSDEKGARLSTRTGLTPTTTSKEGEPRRKGQRQRPRPQTAIAQSESLHGPSTSCALDAGSKLSASWRPVWESLQRTGLLLSPKSTSGIELDRHISPSAGLTVERPESRRATGSVDFRKQRRARTAVRAASAGRFRGTAPGRDAEDKSDRGPSEDDDSVSARISDDADDRDEIKRRASSFGASGNFSAGTMGDCAVTASSYLVNEPTSCEHSASKRKARDRAAGNDCCRREHFRRQGTDKVVLQTTATSWSATNTLQESRRRGAARRTAASRRSFAAMDDSGSSSDSSDEDVKKIVHDNNTSMLSGKSGIRGRDCRRGSGQDTPCATTIDSSSPPARRASAIQAGRKLGFDLKRSLAAINEWTKISTATITGSNRDFFAFKTGRRRECSGFDDNISDIDGVGRPLPPPFVVADSTTAIQSPATSAATGTSLRSTLTANREIGFRLDETKKCGSCSQSSMSCQALVDHVSDATNAATAGKKVFDSDDTSEDEAVLSVAAARAALGISRVGGSYGGAVIPVTFTAVSLPQEETAAKPEVSARKPKWHSPRHADIGTVGSSSDAMREAFKSRGKGKDRWLNGNRGVTARHTTSDRQNSENPSRPQALGIAVGMSDEKLESMLRQQPRNVPELRTKDSFRDFFKGMEAGRMGRLLKGAYDGTLSPGEVERKVEKRLGLVGDMLAW